MDTYFSPKLQKIKLGQWWVLLFLWSLTACATSSLPASNNETLQTAKTLYSQVSELKGDIYQNTLRCDWLPWYYESAERVYLYSIPYFPYLTYNSAATWLKESLLIPAWPVLGGTSHQDQADDLVASHRLEYNLLFQTCWPQENNHANFVNMDQWEMGRK